MTHRKRPMTAIFAWGMFGASTPLAGASLVYAHPPGACAAQDVFTQAGAVLGGRLPTVRLTGTVQQTLQPAAPWQWIRPTRARQESA